MKPQDLAIALRCCIEIKQPVSVWGHPGIGKSEIVRQVGTQMNLPVQDVRAVLLDPVDLRGLPIVTSKGKAHWATPEFLPTSGAGILFLDELNRAPALVQNACFQLVLDRKLGEYELPADWSVVAACNPTGGGTTKMSDALANRFVHLEAETSVDDWSKWALGASIDPMVIAFIRFRNELLHQHSPQAKAYPTPRSWEFVSRITAAHPGNGVEHGLYAGAVGEGAAVEYSSFLRLYRELPNLDAILLEPKKAIVPKEPATLYAVASALAHKATDTNIGRVIEYIDRLPQEYAVMCMKDAIQKTPVLASTKEFTKWTVKNQEVFA